MSVQRTDARASPEFALGTPAWVRRPRLRPTGRLWALVHATSLVIALAVLLGTTRHQWFSTDEWDFLTRRGLHHPDFSIWWPHNEHWSTIPILIYRALYSVFGLRTYTPYILVLFTFHLALTHLLWRVMLRSGVEPSLATCLAGIFALLGAGHENLLWAFQIGFIGSVALGVLVVLLVDHEGPADRRDLGAVALAVVALTFSGITVTMVLIAGLTAAFRRRLRTAVLVVLVPAAVYLVWLLLVGHHGLGASKITRDSLLLLPDYVWFGLRIVFESSLGLVGGGPVVLLGLAYWMSRRSSLGAGRAAPAFAMAVGSVALFGLLAVGRSALGVQQAGAPRYTYIGAALVLPATGLALGELAVGAVARRVFVLVVLGLVLVHNLAVLQLVATLQAGYKLTEKRTIMARAEVAASGQATVEPAGALIPDSALRRAARDGKLPPLSFLTMADRLAAATAMQLAVAPTPLAVDPTARARITSVTGAESRPGQPGCVVLTGTTGVEVQLSATGPLSVRFEAPVPEITAFLKSAPPVVDGPPKKFPPSPGAAEYINMTAIGRSLALQLAGGVHVVCGLAS